MSTVHTNPRGYIEDATITSTASAAEIVERSYSDSVTRFLFREEDVSPAFFDLSTGIAGEVLQKFKNYGIRAAFVLGQGRKSEFFRQMAREETEKGDVGFFPDEDSAVAWLGK